MLVIVLSKLTWKRTCQVNFDSTMANIEEKPPVLAITGEKVINYTEWFRVSFGDLLHVFRNDQTMDESSKVTFEAIALYPGETTAEGWYALSLDTMRVVKRPNFEVCTKYSERAIRILTEFSSVVKGNMKRKMTRRFKFCDSMERES